MYRREKHLAITPFSPHWRMRFNLYNKKLSLRTSCIHGENTWLLFHRLWDGHRHANMLLCQPFSGKCSRIPYLYRLQSPSWARRLGLATYREQIILQSTPSSWLFGDLLFFSLLKQTYPVRWYHAALSLFLCRFQSTCRRPQWLSVVAYTAV